MVRICIAATAWMVAALFQRQCVGADDGGGRDPILALRGMGKAIWEREDADAYVERLRSGWQ